MDKFLWWDENTKLTDEEWAVFKEKCMASENPREFFQSTTLEDIKRWVGENNLLNEIEEWEKKQ